MRPNEINRDDAWAGTISLRRELAGNGGRGSDANTAKFRPGRASLVGHKMEG
jgi:hypothetical protein